MTPVHASPPGAPASVAAHADASLAARRQGDEGAFPIAGAALLLFLVVLAVLARWWGPRARTGGASDGAAGRHGWLRTAAGGAAPRVLDTVRLDAHARLHVVDWDGGRVLLAVMPGAAPVVLDRRSAARAHPDPVERP